MGAAALAVEASFEGLFAGPGGAERRAFWQAATGGQAAGDPALELRLAQDILDCMGQVPAERLLARRGPMLVRAASALRAAEAAAPGLRRAVGPGDIEAGPVRVAHAGFFALEALDLRFRRFDGQMSQAVSREVMIACDAVTVLPYDPRRDRVLLVEQMRAAPLLRGDPNPWQIEAVAGRIDPGETPEEAALREAAEEAGLTVERLVPIASYYPSTGALAEYLYAFVGLCALPDGGAGLHGVAEEAEDIRGHLLDWTEVQARLAGGEFTCGPLLLSLYWLAGARDGLRKAAGVGGI